MPQIHMILQCKQYQLIILGTLLMAIIFVRANAPSCSNFHSLYHLAGQMSSLVAVINNKPAQWDGLEFLHVFAHCLITSKQQNLEECFCTSDQGVLYIFSPQVTRNV